MYIEEAKNFILVPDALIISTRADIAISMEQYLKGWSGFTTLERLWQGGLSRFHPSLLFFDLIKEEVVTLLDIILEQDDDGDMAEEYGLGGWEFINENLDNAVYCLGLSKLTHHLENGSIECKIELNRTLEEGEFSAAVYGLFSQQDGMGAFLEKNTHKNLMMFIPEMIVLGHMLRNKGYSIIRPDEIWVDYSQPKAILMGGFFENKKLV